MLTKPTARVLQAFAHLEGHPDFEAVREWVAQSLDTIRRDTDQSKDEVLTRWNQGACQALDQVLATAASAKEVIRRSR